MNCLRLLIRVGADIDHDYDDQSPLEAACRSTALSGLECACELIVYGAHIADGYAPSSLRPAMIAWARDRTHAHYGAVVVAMAARSGTSVGSTPSPLRRLEPQLQDFNQTHCQQPRLWEVEMRNVLIIFLNINKKKMGGLPS